MKSSCKMSFSLSLLGSAEPPGARCQLWLSFWWGNLDVLMNAGKLTSGRKFKNLSRRQLGGE